MDMDEIYKSFLKDQDKNKKKVSIFYPYNSEIKYLLEKKESKLSIYEWLNKRYKIGSSYENFNRYCKRNMETLNIISTSKNNIKEDVQIKIENTHKSLSLDDPAYDDKVNDMKNKIEQLIQR